MPSIYTSEAFVLKKKQLLKQDLLITLFMKEMGKVRVMAKGVQKLTSRRASGVETGNFIHATVHESNGAFFLNDVRLISGFTMIKESEQKRKAAYLYFFILDRILPENQQEEKAYALTKQFLVSLSKHAHSSNDFVSDNLYDLLVVLGYVRHPLPYHDLIATVESIIHEKIPQDII